MTEQYVPTKEDYDWLGNLLNSLRDGGVWGLPENNAVFQVDKKNRVLTLIDGPRDYLFDRLEAVALLHFYTVKEKERHEKNSERQSN